MSNTNYSIKIDLFWPAVAISVFLAVFKLTGVFNISWLAVASPVLFVLALGLLFVTLFILGSIAYIILKVLSK